jgi:Protein of unknown function (DUF4232)
MRSNKRLSVLALVVVAAGLSLTACGPDDSSASGTTSSPSASDPALSSSASGATSTPSAEPSQDGSSGSGSTSGGSSGGSGSGSKSSSSGGGSSSSSSSKSGGSGMCQTSNLAISAEHGMSGEGMELVNFKNIGSSSCTMHGFAGADLKNGSDSVSVSRRSGGDVPTVELAPGEENGFVLYYPYNNSGGSGYTFTTMTVTPPNETHSKTISAAINIPVTSQNSKSAGSGISMYAVGAGK